MLFFGFFRVVTTDEKIGEESGIHQSQKKMSPGDILKKKGKIQDTTDIITGSQVAGKMRMNDAG